MSERLWNDYDGEPWLDNPRVFLFNKRRKGKKAMARRKARRGKKAAPRRNRVYRRRGVKQNPPRRRAAPRRRRASAHGLRPNRRARRNPPMVAGLNLKQLLTGGAAVIISPMIEKQLMPMLPASVAGTVYGRWAVKLGSALGTWYLAKSLMGRRSSDVVAIALGSMIVADAVDEFAPTLTGGLSAYTRGGLRAYSPVGQRRGLGLVMPGQMTRGMQGVLAPRNRIGVRSDPAFAPPF